jgi:hypothetical protein
MHVQQPRAGIWRPNGTRLAQRDLHRVLSLGQERLQVVIQYEQLIVFCLDCPYGHVFKLPLMGEERSTWWQCPQGCNRHLMPPVQLALLADLTVRPAANDPAGSSPSFRPALSLCTISQYPFFPVVFISQSKGPALNQLDFVVEPFGHAVGVAMLNVARNRFKPPT